MANIVPFKEAPLPAHVQKFMSGNSNIDERIKLNQLTFRGKVWRQVIDGEERALVNKDDEPISTVHVVVLNFNKSRSRAYYEGAFEEGKSKPPVCWSMDGEKPDPSVKEPPSSTCAKCQYSAKGSKITPNGKETAACSVFKRLAVVPLSDLKCPPMLLRLAQTSMWDKDNEENEKKGFYAWDQYTDMLRKNGATHTGVVATKIKFDQRVAYPKLVFAASRWLEGEELEEVAALCESDEVSKLLNASEVAAAARKPDSTDTDDEDETPAVKPGKPAKAAAPVDDDDDEEAPPPPKKKAAPVVDDDDEEAPPPPKAKKAAAEAEAAVAKAAKKSKAAPAEEAPKPAKKGNGIADLVKEWDDED